MNDKAIEQEIQDKGLTAPRITPDDIAAAIKSEYFFRLGDAVATACPEGIWEEDEPALKLTTVCVIVMRNGFTVTGKSACASPENFDAELGRKIARQNAVSEIWPLMGYELRSKLAAQ